ncbi:MAG: hypothetical protein AAGA01_00020 [Cyanobacteria bacterium P01_E01_bin.43]
MMTSLIAETPDSYTQARAFVGALFDYVHDGGLTYAVLRGYEGLPHQITHDIDMGVLPADFAALIGTIQAVAQAHGGVIIRHRRKADFQQIYVLCDTRIVKLDIWCALDFRGVRYLDMEQVLAARMDRDGLWVLPPDTEALLTALKEILHNGTISARKAALVLDKSPLPPTARDLGFPKEQIQAVWDHLRQSDHPASAKALRAGILAAINPGFLKGIAARIRFAVGYLDDRLRPTGRFIVLLGPDGSGKTTLSRLLMADVSNRTGLNGRCHYVHGRFGILPNLGRLRGRSDRTGTMILGYEEKRDGGRVHGRGRLAVYLAYYFWDFFLGHCVLRWRAYQDSLTVADRYFYDYFLQPMYGRHGPLAKGLYLWLLPRPHKVIFLKADPAAIVARKPELTAVEIHSQQQKIEVLLTHPTLRKRSVSVATDTHQTSTQRALRRKVYTS